MNNNNFTETAVSTENLLASQHGGGDYKTLEDGMYDAVIVGVVQRDMKTDKGQSLVHELVFLVTDEGINHYLTSKSLIASLNEKSNLSKLCKEWFKATDGNKVIELLTTAKIITNNSFAFGNFIGLNCRITVTQVPSKKDNSKLFATITGYSPAKNKIVPVAGTEINEKMLNKIGDTVGYKLHKSMVVKAKDAQVKTDSTATCVEGFSTPLPF